MIQLVTELLIIEFGKRILSVFKMSHIHNPVVPIFFNLPINYTMIRGNVDSLKHVTLIFWVVLPFQFRTDHSRMMFVKKTSKIYLVVNMLSNNIYQISGLKHIEHVPKLSKMIDSHDCFTFHRSLKIVLYYPGN